MVVHPPLFAGVIPTPAQLGARRDVGFVAGWSAGADSPNADALDWFARRILPHVRARVPGTRLLVTGADPPLNVRRLVTPAIEFVGRVTSLADFYASVRVVVVPVRYGSGVKIKTVEAVHFAVPTVATTVVLANRVAHSNTVFYVGGADSCLGYSLHPNPSPGR